MLTGQIQILWIKSSPVLKWLSNIIIRASYQVTAEVKSGDDPGSAVSHLSPEISHSSPSALRGQPHLRMMSFKGDSTENYLWKYYIYMDEFLCDWQCRLEGFSQCLQSAYTVCLHLLTRIDVIRSRYWKEHIYLTRLRDVEKSHQKMLIV